MESRGWIEALNQGVRSIVTLALVGGFIFGYVFLKTISGEVYTAVVSGVIGYWFAARQGEQAAKAAVEAIAAKATNGTDKTVLLIEPPKEPKP